MDVGFHELLLPGKNDLIKLHHEWLAATETEKEDFRRARLRLVKKHGGRFFSQAHQGTTSGYSTGTPKGYRWGPNFWEVHAFNEWLKFREHTIERTIYIKVAPNPKSLYFARQDSMDYIVLDSFQLFESCQTAGRMFRDTRNALYMLPSYAQFLIANQIRLADMFDPETNIIYVTGEPSSPELRAAYRQQGFHYLDCMRSWMGGVTTITCKYGQEHLVDYLSKTVLLQSDEDPNAAEIVTTDWWNLAQPFIDYPTGDYLLGYSRGELCQCGMPSDRIEFLNRNPTIVVAGKAWPYQELLSLVQGGAVRSRGVFAGCTFSLESGTLVVEMLMSEPLASREEVEKAIAKYVKVPVRIHEHLAAGPYKVLAVKEST